MIEPNGNVTEIEPKNGTDFTLDEMCDHIGCSTIQISEGKDGKILVFDEEFFSRGDIENHHIYGMCVTEKNENGDSVLVPYLNHKATLEMAARLGPFTHNVICGKCLVCNSSQVL